MDNQDSFSDSDITRPNCALDRRTILYLYVSGFQRQVFNHVGIFSERSQKKKEQKKNKGSVFVAESAHNAQNAQFGLLMELFKNTYSIATQIDANFIQSDLSLTLPCQARFMV